MEALLKRKARIERDFARMSPRGVGLTIIPRLPESLDLTLTLGPDRTSRRTIHVNENHYIRQTLRLHGVI